jgi:hypothetical protein
VSANPVHDRAQALLAAVVAGMAATPGGAPASALVAPGDQSWDRCCDGAAWVRIVRLFAYETFPTPATGSLLCPGGLAVELEAVALRCAPVAAKATSGVRGSLVTPGDDAMESAAAQLHADAYQILDAVTTTLAVWRADDLQTAMTQWIPLGPDGGCLGGALTVIVEV